MNTNETVRESTKGQYKDIIATVIGGIPDDLTFDEAVRLTRAKGKLVSHVTEAIYACAGRNTKTPQTHSTPSSSNILRPLFEDEKIVIPRCDGKQTIAQAERVFTCYIDSRFEDPEFDQEGSETPETPVSVYKIAQNTSSVEMFHSLGYDLDRLALTQHQIVAFVETHLDKVRSDGSATFFLVKNNNKLFVVDVRERDSRLHAYVDLLLEDGDFWDANYHHQVVVPQLLQS